MSDSIRTAEKKIQLFNCNEITQTGFVELRIRLKYPKVYIDTKIDIVRSNGATRTYALTLRPGALRSRIVRIAKDVDYIGLRIEREETEIILETKQLIKFPIPVTLWIIQQRLKHFKRSMPLSAPKIWRAYNQTFDTRLGINNYQQWIKHKEPQFKPSTRHIRSLTYHRRLNLILFAPESGSPELEQASHTEHSDICTYDLRDRDPRVLSGLEKKISENIQTSDEYFLMIHSSDQLSAQAMQAISIGLNSQANVALAYTDEDRLISGHRALPEFKPCWNPEYFLESNYLGKAVIFHPRFLTQVDWQTFEPNYQSLSKLIAKDRIMVESDKSVLHIPHICLHKSAADDSPKARYARVKNVLGEALGTDQGTSYPSTEILIPSRDKFEILEACIKSIIEKTNYDNYRISILDNGSVEPASLNYLNEIQKHPRIQVLSYPHPFNYSAINNFGAEQSDAEVIVLLNNDIEVISANWLDEMISLAMSPNAGCIGAKLYYPNGWIQHAGVVLGIGDIAGHTHRFYPGDSPGYMNRLICRQRISAVTAACLAVRKSIWDQVGGLDADNLSVAYNDVDFCLRVQEAGYHNLWTPHAELVHHESLSRGSDDTTEKKKRYQLEVKYMRERWAKELQRDEFYHQVFSRSKEDFSLIL